MKRAPSHRILADHTVCYLALPQACDLSHICILPRVPDPCQTMPSWTHTSHTYLSMLYHECMGTCGHGSTRQQVICHVAKGHVRPCTPETRMGPCASGGPPDNPMCIHATRDSIDPGGPRFAWNRVRCP